MAQHGEGGTDDAVGLCSAWMRLREEADSLQRRWGAAESALIAQSVARKLTRRESAVLPEAGALRDVEAAMDDVEARIHAAFEAILASSTQSIDGVIAKLDVVRKRVELDCEEDVRRLLSAAIEDLRGLWRRLP